MYEPQVLAPSKMSLSSKTQILIVFAFFMSLTLTAQPVRERVNLNRCWKFMLGDASGAERVDYDDGSWTDIHLPHSFSIPYFMWTDVYHGYGWYRKTIDVGEAWQGKCIGIEFEGSFIDTEVFMNGQKVGKHVGGYTGFAFDLTPYLQKGENILAVRVNNLWNPRVAPRAGDHQFSGGIYRDVWLNVTSPLHVPEYGIFIYTPQVSHDAADVCVQTELRNDADKDEKVTLTTDILNDRGVKVASTNSKTTLKHGTTSVVKQTIKNLKNPQLWSPEHPYRYHAVIKVSVNGKLVDQYETRFGIRWMQWTADRGFFLNGGHYYLLGVNVHQDQAGWGDAVTNGAMTRDVQAVKDAGLNSIRGSHYPHDPAFAAACDSIGLLLFMENAFWGCGGHAEEVPWGQGPPASSYPTVEADQPAFEQSVLLQLKEMIRIHRNSPSIACWSLSNEPFFCTSDVDEKMKKLLLTEMDSARAWDPTRQVAVGGAQRKDIDKLGKGAIAFYNGDGASRPENQDPGVPSIVSEYGYPEGDRPNNFEPRWGDLGDGYHRPEWRSGQVIWCGFDHGTVAGYGLAKTGFIDYFRLPKRNYYWYVEAYKKGNRNPVEPVWPRECIPARLGLRASQQTIPCTDGTDDAQIIVQILDANGRHISNSQPVTLTIVSGPGEFPTGRSITFTSPTASHWKEMSADPKCDIRIMDGEAAIAFRSYHGGSSVIRATSDGLEPAQIVIQTKGEPQWREGIDRPVPNRPYRRYYPHNLEDALEWRTWMGADLGPLMTLADQRPTWSSSVFSGSNKVYANDGDESTAWKPAANDPHPWLYVSLEFQYSISCIDLIFPEEANYQYIVEVGKTVSDWTTVIDKSSTTEVTDHQTFEGDFGHDITYVRIRFTGKRAGLAELRVGRNRN